MNAAPPPGGLFEAPGRRSPRPRVGPFAEKGAGEADDGGGDGEDADDIGAAADLPVDASLIVYGATRPRPARAPPARTEPPAPRCG
jgi:hypothetical protein